MIESAGPEGPREVPISSFSHAELALDSYLVASMTSDTLRLGRYAYELEDRLAKISEDFSYRTFWLREPIAPEEIQARTELYEAQQAVKFRLAQLSWGDVF